MKRNQRSADGGEFASSEGVETIEIGDVTAVRKGRSIGLASAVGLKLGFGAGLAIGLGADKHARKDADSAHAKNHKSHGHARKSHGHVHKDVHHGHARKDAHHKIEHESVCNHVPSKSCKGEVELGREVALLRGFMEAAQEEGEADRVKIFQAEDEEWEKARMGGKPDMRSTLLWRSTFSSAGRQRRPCGMSKDRHNLQVRTF